MKRNKSLRNKRKSIVLKTKNTTDRDKNGYLKSHSQILVEWNSVKDNSAFRYL